MKAEIEALGCEVNPDYKGQRDAARTEAQQLRTDLDAALELIRQAEWSGVNYGHASCPWCWGLKERGFFVGRWHDAGHRPDCPAYALMFNHT